jgi:hypothetical protein
VAGNTYFQRCDFYRLCLFMKMLVHKREEITGDGENISSEELHNVYS